MKKILLVDDEEEILELLKPILERNGYEITTAVDGQKAIDAARDLMPDLIMMDVMMPNMTGREAASALMQDIVTKHIPVIFLSGTAYNSSEGKVIEVFEVDGKQFQTIAKPFELENIVARVRRFFEQGS